MSYYVLAGVDSSKLCVVTINQPMINGTNYQTLHQPQPNGATCQTSQLQAHKSTGDAIIRNSCRVRRGTNNLPCKLLPSMIALMDWRLIVVDMRMNSVFVDKIIMCINRNDELLLLQKCSEQQQNVLYKCDMNSYHVDHPVDIKYSEIKVQTDGDIVNGMSALETSLFWKTENGVLFCCKNKELSNPERINLSNRKVKQVSCGKEHTVVLTTLGEVYTFGGGSRAQLGHGDLETLSEPKLVEALSGVMITAVECGGWHTLALSDIGDVYSWGWNESGQVGVPCMKNEKAENKIGDHDGQSMVTCPTLLFEDDADLVIEQISCGSRHSASLTEDGCLYMWGWNGHGQLLMREDVQIQDRPAKTHSMISKFSHIKCGGWSSLAFYEPPDDACSPAMASLSRGTNFGIM